MLQSCSRYTEFAARQHSLDYRGLGLALSPTIVLDGAMMMHEDQVPYCRIRGSEDEIGR